MTATTTTKEFRGYSATAIYSTDNGRMLCGAHLGSSARFTGRDISGQRIERLSATDMADMEAFMKDNDLSGPLCESCRYAR